MLTNIAQTIASPAPIALSPEQRTLAAVAIGTHNCHVVVLQHQWDGSYTIQQAAELPITANAWEQPRELGSTINHWLSEMKLPKTIPVACILPSGMVEYESLDVPEGVLDLDAHVASNLEEILGREMNAVTYAYWQAGAVSKSDLVYLSWTPSAFATELANSLSRVGRECTALEPLAPVLAKIGFDDSLQRGLDSITASRLIVFLEGSQVTTVLATGDLPSYVRSQIGLCEQSPQQLVQANLNISSSSAVTLLRDWGIGDSSPSGSGARTPIHHSIADAIQPWSTGLVFEIQRTVRFLKHRHGVSDLTQILLCGESAMVAGLADHLTEELDQNVCPAQLPVNCRWLSAQSHNEALAVPLALGMQGVVA